MTRSSALVFVSLFTLAMTHAGCRPRAYVRSPTLVTQVQPAGVIVVESAPPPPVMVQEPVATSFELLYLPAQIAALPLQLIQSVLVQADDGRAFQLTQADLQHVMGGRIAVRIPHGVTSGIATIYAIDGRTWSTQFQIAASSNSITVSAGSAALDPRCSWPNGVWQGTVTNDPYATSTVWLEVLGDCRTVRGQVHLESPSGSVDSTIEGTWDVATMTIIARDTQLFRLHPMPGYSFCATDEYRLQLSPDGNRIMGQNNTWSGACRTSSTVLLQRAG
jgi:hypothetical protein